MEEAFKMRNVLQEFLRHQGTHRPTILGMREHIFTGRLVIFFPSKSNIPVMRVALCFLYEVEFNMTDCLTKLRV